MRPLTTYFPHNGSSDATFHLLAADSAAHVGEPTDPDEAERVEWLAARARARRAPGRAGAATACRSPPSSGTSSLDRWAHEAYGTGADRGPTSDRLVRGRRRTVLTPCGRAVVDDVDRARADEVPLVVVTGLFPTSLEAGGGLPGVPGPVSVVRSGSRGKAVAKPPGVRWRDRPARAAAARPLRRRRRHRFGHRPTAVRLAELPPELAEAASHARTIRVRRHRRGEGSPTPTSRAAYSVKLELRDATRETLLPGHRAHEEGGPRADPAAGPPGAHLMRPRRAGRARVERMEKWS